MGDTSIGKSSVLFAISGIEFPSSDTLTTRSPTQIVLSEADKFSGTSSAMKANQSAMLLVSLKYAVEGERTIAIITKPDAIDPGAERSVYHAVRCRGKKHHDDKMTIPEGLAMKRDFFHNHKVWKSVAPSYVDYSLPIVLKEIMDKLLKREESLEQLGSGMNTAQDRRLFYSSFVSAALQLMKDALQGDYADFFFAISTSAVDWDNRAKAIICKHDAKFQQEVDSRRSVTGLPRENGHARICRVEALEDKDIKCLGIMHKQIVDNRGDELSIFPSYKLFCSLMREYIQKWDAPMKTLLTSYAHVCQDVFSRLLRYCGDEKFSRLNEHSPMVLDQWLKTVRAATNRVIAESLHAEYRPFTMNPAIYENLMKLRNEPLKRALEGLTAKGCREVNLDAVLAILAMNGIGAQGDDHREALELHVALKVYLEVAKNRVVDKFPMLLQEHFVCKLLGTLQIQFASISNEQLEVLLRESKAAQNYRHQLGSELESLKAGEKEISSMYYSSGSSE
ncbi:hypothetical protein BJ741DRAFT_699576 [Chytriomyces cf. hyalinus JEL632]|nr:hypothetical protein BJ741DRAFT_699576 [Chytriomyces cf. hyalinus JEL632]